MSRARILTAAGILALVAASLMILSRATPREGGASALPAKEAPPAPARPPLEIEALPEAEPRASARHGSVAPDAADELIASAYDRLPRVADLRDLSEEEAHDVPGPVEEGAILLGEIAQSVEDDARLAPAALRFYERCARDREVVTSLRALCYSHVLEEGAGRDEDVGEDVERLARMVPSR